MSILEKFENNKSYTDRDINALRRKVVNFVKQETDKWSDFNDSDIGMVLLDVVTGLCDYNSFYLDKQANECFLDRATEPKNIKSILYTLGYQIPFPKGAVTRVIFAIPDGINKAGNVGDVTTIEIPEWTQISAKMDNDQDIVFCTKQKAELTETSKWVDVEVVQGRRILRNCYTTQVVDCRLDLGEANIESGKIILSDISGKWEQVEDAFLEYAGGRKFSVHLDCENNAYILFTWNYLDFIKTDNQGTFTVEYLETMGDEGNVPAMTIDTMVDILYPKGSIEPAPVYVRNVEDATGGANTPDLYKMIVNRKKGLKQMDRCVTLQDYEDAALMYPGVAEAKACDINSNPDLVPSVYSVKVYVRGEAKDSNITGSYEFNLNYLDNLRDWLQKRGVCIIMVYAENVQMVPFSVSAKVYSNQIPDKDEMTARIKDALNAKFAYGQLKLGSLVTSTMIKDTIMQTNNLIQRVDLVGFDQPINATVIQYPYLRNINVEWVEVD